MEKISKYIMMSLAFFVVACFVIATQTNINDLGITSSNFSCTDCIGTAQTKDIYLFNSGDTMTGTLTMSGAGIVMGSQSITGGSSLAFTTLDGNLNAGNLTGTISRSRLSTNIAYLNMTQTRTGTATATGATNLNATVTMKNNVKYAFNKGTTVFIMFNSTRKGGSLCLQHTNNYLCMNSTRIFSS